MLTTSVGHRVVLVPLLAPLLHASEGQGVRKGEGKEEGQEEGQEGEEEGGKGAKEADGGFTAANDDGTSGPCYDAC